jgi:CysZ protein
MTHNYSAGDYLLRGFKLLSHPKLRLFVLFPILMNILFMVGLLFLAKHYFHHLVAWLVSFLPSWLAWLSSILWLLFAMLTALIFTYTFTIVSNILAAPFNGLLAEKVQELYGDRPPSADMTMAQVIAATPRNVARAGRSFLYFLPRAILFIPLLFIPLVHLIVPILWFIFNAWMMSIQYMDYPMDNNNIGFKEMLGLLSTQRSTNFSFGAFVLLGTMIPVINLVVMPAAVIGATLLWQDCYAQKSALLTQSKEVIEA